MILIDKLIHIINYLGISGFCDFILFIAIFSFLIFHYSPFLIALKLRKISRESVTELELLRELKKINPFLNSKKEDIQNIEITDYINEYTTITYPGRRRVAQTIPGILTAFGILGTFIGLVKGLVTFNVTNTETLSSSINMLMGGIRLAFYTSIVAIFSSIVWTFLDKLFLRFYDGRLEDFYRRISARFSFSEKKKIEESNFDSRFFEMMDKTFEKGFEKFAQIFKEEISSELEKFSLINKELQELQRELAREVNGICTDLRNFRSSATEFITQTREINLQNEKSISNVKNIVSGMGEEAELLIKSSRISRELYDDIEKWSENITKRLKEISEGFEKSKISIDKQSDATCKNWKECHTALNEISVVLKSSVKEFSRESIESLNGAMREVDEILGKIAIHLSDSMKETKELMEELPGIIDQFGKKLK